MHGHRESVQGGEVMGYLDNYEQAQSEVFRGRCLMAALSVAQSVLNEKGADEKLRAICQQIVNNPAGTKDTLALNMAAVIDNTHGDAALAIAARDVLTGMAGITE